jgi:GAF domain-containing protein
MPIDDAALVRSLRALSIRRLKSEQMQSLGRQIGDVVGTAGALLSVASIGLLLLDDVDQVRPIAVTGPAAQALDAAQESLRIGPGAESLRTGDTVAVSDLADLSGREDWAPLWESVSAAGVRAVLSTPVRVQDKVVGNLNAVATQPHEWSDDERRVSETLAGLVGHLLGLASSAGAGR